MFGVMFAVLVVAAMGMFGASNADVIPAGKCNTTNIQTVAIKYTRNANLIYWNILYVTKVAPFSDMDYFLVKMTAMGGNTYQEDDTIMYKNSTSSKQTYKQTYVDNIITQDANSTEKPCHFHLYPLAVSKENGILYLRCSEIAGVSVDTRFIAVPKGTQLSFVGLKQLMDKDASYNFKGALIKLPYSLYSGASSSLV